MPKRKVRGARAPGAGPPLPPPLPRLPPPPLPRLWGVRIGAGLEQAQTPCTGARDGVRLPRANPARLGCPRAPEAILEERRPRREEPCWRLFIPLPSGSTCPPRAPSPIAMPPPLPAGGQFKPERAGRRRSGLAGGGARCRQKTAAVRGRGPCPLGRGFAVWPRLRPRPRRTRLGAGARRCRPRVLPAARASSLPPSTAAMVTAPGPRLRRGLFAPSAAVAFAWRGRAGCAPPRSSLQFSARCPWRLGGGSRPGLRRPPFLRALGYFGRDACTEEQSDF